MDLLQFGRRGVGARLLGAAALVGALSTGGVAQDGEGVVRFGSPYCPPCPPVLSPYEPVPMSPLPSFAAPPSMSPSQPSTLPQPSTQPQTPTQPQPSTQPQTPTQPQTTPQAPTTATPTFTPPSTAATSPSSVAPNMIGDFFGGSTSQPTIFPGNLVNQAILLDPGSFTPGSGLLDYYRVITPVTGVPMTFDTVSDVLLGTDSLGQPVSVTPSVKPPQLLQQYDGALFTGDPADLGMVTNPGPFIALDSGTIGDVNLQSPEMSATLIDEPIYNIHDALLIRVPSPGAGGVVGRQKIPENNSVIPRDRMFLNHSTFTDVPLTEDGVNVYRFVPGVEMAFSQETFSVELRVPFAVSLDPDILTARANNTRATELGNVLTSLKMLVHRSPGSAIGVGVSAALPTSSDIRVIADDGLALLSLENEALHILPFIGGNHSRGKWFSQWFLQGDLGVNGNKVLVRNLITNQLEETGRLTDAAFLYLSSSVGYWLYQNGSREVQFDCVGNRQIKRTVYTSSSMISGFAPIAELHLNQSLEQTDAVDAGPLRIESFENFSLINLVLGGHVTFAEGGAMTVAWSTPIVGQDDKQFSNEVRVILEWAH